MAWTERRKRKWLAVVDGVMAFVFVFTVFFLISGFTAWVRMRANHGPDFEKWMITPGYRAVTAIMPESVSFLVILVCVPTGFGFLSYACDESLVSKVFRWLLSASAFGVMLAVSPLVAIHRCLCGDEDQAVWDEFILPGLSVLFLYFSIRLARKRWPPITSSPSPSPSAMSRGDAPPSP